MPASTHLPPIPFTRPPRSLAAEQTFRDRLVELKAILLEPAWLGIGKPHRVRCVAGHKCTPRPGNVQRGLGLCRVCAGQDPATVEQNFLAKLAAVGATPLYEKWQGSKKRHIVRCAAGHECKPRPGTVQQGGGICRVCSKKDPATAEANFERRVNALGGTVLEPTWLGCTKPHRVRCIAGHECKPQPTGVQRGQGLCKICAGNDPVTAERAFLSRLSELGATPLYEKWLGNKTPLNVRCARGHECSPRPCSVRAGQGVCRTCAGKDPVASERAFLSRLVGIGATPLYEKWQGSQHPHPVRCTAGHECKPTPANVLQGHGICLTCAGKDTTVVERAYLAHLVNIGATPLYEKWRGSHHSHLVRCAAGHECTPTPHNVLQGHGLCNICSPAGFNFRQPGLIYLVTHPRLGAHKLGVGAANGARLQKWRREGWKVHQTLHFPVGADAHRVEQAVLGWLRIDLGLKPFLRHIDGEGWTETVDASIIEPAAIWDRVERLAWA